MKETLEKAKHVKDSLTELSSQVKEGKGVIVEAVRKDLAKLGLVAGAAAFGAVLLSLAGLLLVLFLILLLDVFVGRLWLSTLIVMSGMALTGAVLLIYGAKRLKKAKELLVKGFEDFLSREEAGKPMVETVEEVRNTSREILDTLKARKEAREAQAKALLQKARSNAPAIVVGLLVLKKLKDRRAGKRVPVMRPESW